MTQGISVKEGLTLPPFHYTIERGKIREFALSIGDKNPIYHDRAAALAQGFRDVPIPFTFPAAIEMWAGMSFEKLVVALEVNPLLVLHGEQEYEYLGDVCAGDELTGVSTIASTAVKKGLNLFIFETEYTNQYGKKVLISRSTILERHA